MTAAAFRATYSDWRVVKGRKVVQVVFEVPIESADLAYQVVGGMPHPGTEAWFGIAKLDPRQQQEEQAAPRKAPVPTAQPRQGSPTTPHPAGAPKHNYAQRLGIACSQPAFWQFVRGKIPQKHYINVDNVDSEATAADAVRFICGVTSRRDTHVGSPAGDKARDLLLDYDNYLRDVA
jgi:hypothetical protein